MNPTNELHLLTITAASIAFIHTILGPDHYLPFIAMAKAGKWSKFKTVLVTILCGLGHVGSSILLGLLGVLFGLGLKELELFESFRGNLAAWSLIAFGLLYLIWGIKKSFENHHHEHAPDTRGNLTPWILFTIFVFGPCEPLIPLLMVPALQSSYLHTAWIAGVFAFITILTMLGVVLLSSYGISLLSIHRLERYTHALAGLTICLCGLGIQFLGL